MTRTASARLDGWKVISAYLGCDVGTAQRWEKEAGLPVHRVPGGRRQGVFAVAGELDAWLELSKPADSSPPPPPRPPSVTRSRARRVVGLAFLAVALAAVALWLRRDSPSTAGKTTSAPPQFTLALAGQSTSYRRVELPVGAHIVRIADFNGDALPDLAFTRTPSSVVSVLLGLGKGAFGPAEAVETCPAAQDMAADDFDADGDLDLLVTCQGPGAVRLLWNDNGAFARQAELYRVKSLVAAATGDVNNDGAPDVLVLASEAGKLVTLLNRRTHFEALELPLWFAPRALAAAELTGDGKLDILVGAQANNGLQLLVGQGDGRFHPGASVKTPALATNWVAADLNHDSRADVVVDVAGTLHVFLAEGTGFRAVLSVEVARGGVLQLTLADLDRDGHLDLITNDRSGGSVAFHLSDGQGRFRKAGGFDAGGFLGWVAAEDLDQDGVPDMVAAMPFEPRLLLYLTAKP